MVLVRDHDVAHGRVNLERVHRHVFAEARLFEAAVGHFVGQHEVRVDPCAAVLKPRGYIHSFTHVLRPNRRCEAVIAVVGPLDRFVLVGEPCD